MKIGPKYKIARRLGAPVFEKTQSAKFGLHLARKDKIKSKKRPKQKTNFGIQLSEKQKAKYTYGLNERQMKSLVRGILEKKSKTQNDDLFSFLEKRLDNVVARLGWAKTRRFARQTVSHGHVCINGKKVTVPSYHVSKGDVITVRGGSSSNAIFANLEETTKDIKVPNWLTVDQKKKEAKVQGEPTTEHKDVLFDISSIFEFYKR